MGVLEHVACALGPELHGARVDASGRHLGREHMLHFQDFAAHGEFQGDHRWDAGSQGIGPEIHLDEDLDGHGVLLYPLVLGLEAPVVQAWPFSTGFVVRVILVVVHCAPNAGQRRCMMGSPWRVLLLMMLRLWRDGRTRQPRVDGRHAGDGAYTMGALRQCGGRRPRRWQCRRSPSFRTTCNRRCRWYHGVRRTGICAGVTRRSLGTCLGRLSDLLVDGTEEIRPLRHETSQVRLHVVGERGLLPCALDQGILLVFPLGVQKQYLQVMRHLLGWDELASDRASLHDALRGRLAVTHVVLAHLHLRVLRWQRDLRLLLHRFFFGEHFLLRLLPLPLLALPLFALALLALPLLLALLLLFLFPRLFLGLFLLDVDLRLLSFLFFRTLGLFDARFLRDSTCAGLQGNRGASWRSCRGVERRSERDVVVLSGEFNCFDHAEVMPVDLGHVLLLLSLLLFLGPSRLLLLLVPCKARIRLINQL
mmetsp:Transcript_48393/g.135187  ORF Transcript_48393/g.135187 Transcript_48393/m.135187 type:complete len:478 (+) Transcript_48393:193-1626(+)